MIKFGDILGNDKDIDDILGKITTTIEDLPRASERINTPDKLVSSAINDTISAMAEEHEKGTGNKDGAYNPVDDLNQLFDGMAVSNDRLARYAVYNTIYTNVQIVKRIIQIYVNSVFVKDSIDSHSLTVKTKETSTNNEEKYKYKAFTEEFLKYFNIEKNLNNKMAFNVFKYGDCFVELIDTSEQNTLFPTTTEKKKNSYVSESVIIEEFNNKATKHNEYTSHFDDIDFAKLTIS